MALLGNTSYNHRNPQRHFGHVSAGTAFVAGNERKSWRQSGQLKNLPLHDGRPAEADKTGYPSGRKHPYSYSMPYKPGAIASVQKAEVVFAGSGAIVEGRNLAGSASLAFSATGDAQLVVSGAGTATVEFSASGTVLAALSAAGGATVAFSPTGNLSADGVMSGAATITFTATAPNYAIGFLAGNAAPAVELEASIFSSYLLDQEDVETGLTLRQALRLIAASTAGKISGEPGATITIRNAVADSKDRMVATLDADKNRTAITYDLT